MHFDDSLSQDDSSRRDRKSKTPSGDALERWADDGGCLPEQAAGSLATYEVVLGLADIVRVLPNWEGTTYPRIVSALRRAK